MALANKLSKMMTRTGKATAKTFSGLGVENKSKSGEPKDMLSALTLQAIRTLAEVQAQKVSLTVHQPASDMLTICLEQYQASSLA